MVAVGEAGDYGAFAPRVFRCAAKADPVALAIAASAARAVGALTRRARSPRRTQRSRWSAASARRCALP